MLISPGSLAGWLAGCYDSLRSTIGPNSGHVAGTKVSPVDPAMSAELMRTP